MNAVSGNVLEDCHHLAVRGLNHVPIPAAPEVVVSDYHFDQLCQAIAGRQVVAVVGTGVSRAATNNAPDADWVGLIKSGIARCEALYPDLPDTWAAIRREQIAVSDTDELITAAELVAKRLGAPNGPDYANWLRDTTGALRVSDSKVPEALHALGVPLATTNYDGLLEQVTGLPPVTWRDGARVERLLHGDELGILHLHGYWDATESVVFGVRSYQAVGEDPHAQAVLHALSLTKIFIFVGFGAGLTDPNFSALLRWRRKVQSVSPYHHVRLARGPDVADLRRQHPPEDRIAVLSYGDAYDELAPFLRSLCALTPPPTVPAAATLPTSMSAPAPASAPPPLAPRPRCFGRETLIQRVVDALLAPEPPALPILGGPGIGKSTVSLTALYEPEVVKYFGLRRFFVRCDGAGTVEAVQREVALAVGLPLGPDLDQRLYSWLADAPTALVLDNFETPWEADPGAAENLLREFAAIPSLAILATLRGSERPRHVTWSESATIPPLELPAARQLFLAVAGQKFSNDLLLGDLLQALDGVPLAVELMAYLAEGEPNLSALWQRWQAKRTALLARPGVAGRLESIEVSIELSITSSRMTDDARRLLTILAALPDGFAHCDIAPILEIGVHPSRLGLLERIFGSLVRRLHPPAPLPPLMPSAALGAASTLRQVGLAYDKLDRLLLLAPVREHVRIHHSAHPSDLARAFNHYGQLAEDLGPRAGSSGGAEAIARLAPEVANLETAILAGLASPHPGPSLLQAVHLTDFSRFSGLGSNRLLLEAYKVARRARARHAEAACIFSLGELALARSEHDEALARFEEALPLYHRVGGVLGEANCIFSLGTLALARSEHDEARARFEEALPLYHRVGDVLGEANCILNLALLLLGNSDTDTVRAMLEQESGILETAARPNTAILWDLMGDEYASQERLTDAIRAYEKACELDPENATYWQDLGIASSRKWSIEKKQESREEVLAAFRKAAGLAPDDPGVHHNLGVALFAAGHPGDALAAFHRATELDPNDAARRRALGEALAQQDRHAEAEVAFRKAAELDPENAAIWDLLGDSCTHQGRHGDAIAAYHRARDLAPEVATYWHDLGTACSNNGDPQAALEALRKADDLSPNAPATINNLAGVYLDLGDLEQATALYRRRVDLSPTDAINAQVSLAVIARHGNDQGQASEQAQGALEIWESALSSSRQSTAGLLENRALALLLLDRPDEAVAILKEALRERRPGDESSFIATISWPPPPIPRPAFTNCAAC